MAQGKGPTAGDNGQTRDIASPGVLYVVATPIGNLEDITLRATRILQEVGLIAAEDTRHTRKLLSHLDIHTPLTSYYKDKEAKKAAEILPRLQAGMDVALVSDAGTPALSDPGVLLVRSAIEAGIRVVPVPGVSAVTAAVSVAGMEEEHFLFLGFCPSKKKQRRDFLNSLIHRRELLMFYEAPRRIPSFLKDCLDIFGDRLCFVARELTKLHEETLRAPLADVLEIFQNRQEIKGEFVVLISGAQLSEEPSSKDLDALLQWCRTNGFSLKDTVKKLCKDLELPRSEVYREALRVWKEDE